MIKYQAGDEVVVSMVENRNSDGDPYSFEEGKPIKPFVIVDGVWCREAPGSGAVKTITCRVVGVADDIHKQMVLLDVTPISDEVVCWCGKAVEEDTWDRFGFNPEKYISTPREESWFCWVGEDFILGLAKTEAGANCIHCNMFNLWVNKSDSYVCYECRR